MNCKPCVFIVSMERHTMTQCSLCLWKDIPWHNVHCVYGKTYHDTMFIVSMERHTMTQCLLCLWKDIPWHNVHCVYGKTYHDTMFIKHLRIGELLKARSQSNTILEQTFIKCLDVILVYCRWWCWLSSQSFSMISTISGIAVDHYKSRLSL